MATVAPPIVLPPQVTPTAPIQLADLLPSYPPYDVPGIQTLLTAKKEYSELGSTVTEGVPPRGKYFKHQLLIQRHLRQYDFLNLFHKTGTGKSCAVTAVSEWFKKQSKSGGHIKHAYFLVRGPTLKSELRNQIVCKCSPAGEYETASVKSAADEPHQKGSVTKELKKWYTITTYKTFANQIRKNYPTKEDDQRLTEDYSGSIFFIDEVHNLHIDPTIRDVKKDKVKEKEETYNQLWRLLHLIERSKVIIASATPMINDDSEIGSVMNLILPANKQFPPDFDFRNATLEQLEPFFRGRISYIRELDTGAVPVAQGIFDGGEYEAEGIKYRSQMTIYTRQMSDFQSQAYLLAKQTSQDKRDLWESEKQAANFVFPPDEEHPNGSWGTEGFQRYIVKEGNDRYRATESFLPWISNEAYIRSLSCKYAEILHLIQNEPGNSFVYGQFLATSGVIVLGLCLEAHGFEKFNETSSIFVGKEGKRTKSFCAGGAADENTRDIRLDFPKRPRYALLTSETSPAKFSAMMEAMNSYENRHGEYIKALISSPVGRDGINLANVLSIHLISSEWNQSAIYQAISRAIRATSHVSLIKEEQDRLLALEQDPALARIEVKVYMHAALAQDGSSIDLMMYRMSEYKDRLIKRMEHFMKQCAIDCQVHYTRNARPSDIDGTAVCDYRECQYKCSDPAPTAEDYSSYDVLYSDEVVENIIDEIKELFQERFFITIGDLQNILSRFRPKFVVLALEKIIVEKIPLVDRFGYTSYLHEDYGTVFLQRDYPIVTAIQPQYSNAYYASVILGLQHKDLSDIVTQLEEGEQREMVDRLEELDPTAPEFSNTLDLLNLESKANLLENAISKYVTGDKSPLTVAVLQKYEKVLFGMHEPVTEIGKMATVLANKGKGRGRKPKPDTKKRTQKVNPLMAAEEGGHLTLDKNTELVYLHTLYTQSEEHTGYSITAKFNKAEGRLRLLKPSEGTGWRDCNAYELPVYNKIIQVERAKRNQQFEDKMVYGFILPDKKFRIRNRMTEKAEAADDSRKINRGQSCETHRIPDLIDIMWHIEAAVPHGVVIETQDPRAMINKVVSLGINHTAEEMATWEAKRLDFYYRWYKGLAEIKPKIKKKDLCSIIESRMKETGRLLVVEG